MYFIYKCKKLSFIAGTGLKYDRGTREYFKGVSATKELFTRMSYDILSTIVRSSHRFQHNLYKIIIIDSIFYE
jgi:hypothetical protein